MNNFHWPFKRERQELTFGLLPFETESYSEVVVSVAFDFADDHQITFFVCVDK